MTTLKNKFSSCPACGGKEVRRQMDYRGIISDSKLVLSIFGDLHIVVCDVCGMGYPSEIVNASELNAFYETEYAIGRQVMGGGKSSRVLALVDAVFERFINLLDPRSNRIDSQRFPGQLNFILNQLEVGIEPLRILEYGAGNAQFSRLLKEYLGAQVEIDLVEPSTIWDADYQGRGYRKIGVSDCDLKPSSYDLIHASHVFQHVPSFSESFSRISRALKPGGRLFLEVPNASEFYWQARQYPNPPYLNFFSDKAISSIAETYDLSVDVLTSFGKSTRTFLWESMEMNGEYH